MKDSEQLCLCKRLFPNCWFYILFPSTYVFPARNQNLIVSSVALITVYVYVIFRIVNYIRIERI